MKGIVLGLMLTGAAVLLCCGLAAFSWRRDGVSAAELWMAGSRGAADPERYIRPDRVLVVRVLNYIGAGLWLAGVLIVVAVTVRPLFK